MSTSRPDVLIDYLAGNFSRPGMRHTLKRAADALPSIDHRVWPYIGHVVNTRSRQNQTADVITALAWAVFHDAYQVPRNGQLRFGQALRAATTGDENRRNTLHTYLHRADPTTIGRSVIRGIEDCRRAGQVPDWRRLHSDLRKILVFGQGHDVKRQWGADMYSAAPAAPAEAEAAVAVAAAES